MRSIMESGSLLRRVQLVLLAVALALPIVVRAAAPALTNDFSGVAAVFDKHCLDCHAADDPEGKLVLESFATLMKGGKSGAAIVPTNSTESLLVKLIEGRIEEEGKKKIMPPGKRKKLGPDEIALIRAWIDAGAPAPTEVHAKELVVPK